jgi:hypothetical protein
VRAARFLVREWRDKAEEYRLERDAAVAALLLIERKSRHAIEIYEEHGGFIGENEPLYEIRRIAIEAGK